MQKNAELNAEGEEKDVSLIFTTLPLEMTLLSLETTKQMNLQWCVCHFKKRQFCKIRLITTIKKRQVTLV